MLTTWADTTGSREQLNSSNVKAKNRLYEHTMKTEHGFVLKMVAGVNMPWRHTLAMRYCFSFAK